MSGCVSRHAGGEVSQVGGRSEGHMEFVLGLALPGMATQPLRTDSGGVVRRLVMARAGPYVEKGDGDA